MYFIATPTEFSYNILGKKLGIAASDIDIGIWYFQIAVQHIFKFPYKLYLVQKNEIRQVVCHF